MVGRARPIRTVIVLGALVLVGALGMRQAARANLYLPYLALHVSGTRPPASATPPATTPTHTPARPTGTPPPGVFEPFGTVELAPAFEVNGSGSDIDSIAFWEATDPGDTLMLVTAKGNQLVEVWQQPFVGRELPPLRHDSFGTDTKVNGVVVDQARDLLYIAVSAPESTVSVFALPALGYLRQLVSGAVDLRGEPNLALLVGPGGRERLYVSADDIVHVYDPGSGAALGDFSPARGLETMAADRFHQALYIPDENGRSGVYAYTPDGAPTPAKGANVFGAIDVFDADAEGIALYTCPADGREDDGRGLIVVADQKKGGTDFEFFDRRSWDHLGTLLLTDVTNTDGVGSTQQALPSFPAGLFAAVNDDKAVAGVGWAEILAATGLSCAAPPTPPTATGAPDRTATITPTGPASATATSAPGTTETATATAAPPLGPRGYLTTPGELAAIQAKAEQGIEPHASNVAAVLVVANKPWGFRLDELEKCSKGAGDPTWADEESGIPRLWARALAYHLTSEERYAEEVAGILESIMVEVREIDWEVEGRQCQLNFSWAAPELVASADLIEDYWADRVCTGPVSTINGNRHITTGPCKRLFQNWLAKVYYGVSYTAAGSMSNWGAAATNAAAHIADYLWDRPDIVLVHRQPVEVDGQTKLLLSSAAAWARVNGVTLARMNGYNVDYIHDKTCDDFTNGADQHDPAWPPVKSQLTELGIVPDDARRSERCNIERYNGEYQGYPQLHIGNVVQQCELMLRRGDRRCFDNVDLSDRPDYRFPSPDQAGVQFTTHLKPGRGSVERSIKAIAVDSGTEWRHDGALAVAYRYYLATGPTLEGLDTWRDYLDVEPRCWQDVCFGTLTHGLAPGEVPELPPTVPPPG